MHQSAKNNLSLLTICSFLAAAFAATIMTTGCGSSDESEFESVAELSTQPIASGTEATDAQLATELEALEKRAIELESTNQTKESAQVRAQIHQKISRTISPDSWQAKTAKQISDVAARNSQLSAEDKQRLEYTKQLVTKFQNQIKFKSPEAARKTADEIIANYERIYGQQTLATAEALIQIGNIEYRAKESDSAISHFHRAVQTLKHLELAEHPQLEVAHTALGALYSRKKKFQPAVANQKAATRIAARLWGDTSIKYADQANQLGVMYHAAGESDTALQILLASEALRRKTLGANDPKVGHSLLNIATVLKDMKRYDAATPTFQRAKASFVAGKQSSSLINQCNLNLATIYMLQNNFPLAEQHLAEVVASAQADRNAHPLQVAEYQYRYSIALAKQGKYETAQPMMERVLQTQQQQLGRGHAETVKTMQAYALLLKTTQQSVAAEKVYNTIRQVSYETESNDFQR